MARFAPPAALEAISPNVVPLLDVMFLLMLFFMLGSDMSQRETALLSLPVADAAKPQSAAADGRLLTLNVVHRDDACSEAAAGRACHDASHWAYAMHGLPLEDDALAARLAAAAGDALEAPDATGQRLSAVTLSIRADRAAPYGCVQRVLVACAAAGIHRTEVAASIPR